MQKSWERPGNAWGIQGKKAGLDEGSREEVRRAEKQGQGKKQGRQRERRREKREGGQGERSRDEY